MNKIAKFIDNERSQPWTIRIVEEGDKYGRDDCLTYENLFDEQASDGTMMGQFVSRYYISTIMDGKGGGMNLMGYEPKWQIESLAMDSVRDYIQKFASSEGWSWEEDGMFGHKFYKDGVELVS